MPTPLGLTSDDGHLVTLRPSESGEFCAIAMGFAVGTARISPDSGDTVQIRLEPEGTLGGAVLSAGGAADGVEVVAWEYANQLIPTQLVARAHQGDPRVAWGTTDRQGRFEITGLRSSVGYSVVAVAAGRFGRPQESDIHPSRDDLVIPLQAVYAVLLRLVDSNGAPIVVPDRYSSQTALVVEPGFRETKFEFVTSGVESILTGDNAMSELPRSAHLILVTSSADEPTLGPFHTSLRFPGYEPTTVEVEAFPLRGIPVEQDVPLRETSSARGDVRVRMHLSATAIEPVSLEFGGLSLNLRSESSGSLAFELPSATNECVIRGIPYGSYEWWVTSAATRPPFPPAGSQPIPINVGPAEAVLDLDFSSLGQISLALDNKDGTEYDGPASVIVMTRHEEDSFVDQFGVLAFASRPYVIRAVPPGRYIVGVKSPVARCVAGEPGEVEVRGGSTEHIAFKLD
jgi:hypothetical protein